MRTRYHRPPTASTGRRHPAEPGRTQPRQGRHVAAASLVAFTVGALALSACGSDSDETATGTGETNAEGDVVVEFVGVHPPATYEQLIEEFEAANDGIAVEYQEVPSAELNTILQSRLGAEETKPDVYLADQPRIPSYAARGFMTDLSDKTDPAGAVLDGAISASSWQDKLWALPLFTSTQVLYYNTDLLEEAGIDPPPADPTQPWTWAQLVDAAAQAQDAGAKWGLMIEQPVAFYQFQALPESLGGGSGVTGGDMLTVDVANDEWVEAGDFYHGLFEDGLAPRGVEFLQTPDMFHNGEIAFYVGGTWRVAGFEEAEDLTYGFAPHPYFENGTPATPTDSWSLALNPNSQVPDEALAFMEFASLNADGNLATVTNYPQIPANLGALDQVQQEGLTDEAWEIIRYQLDNTSVHRPRTVGYVQLEEAMAKALEDIRNGADPADSLSSVQSEVQSAFDRLS